MDWSKVKGLPTRNRAVYGFALIFLILGIFSLPLENTPFVGQYLASVSGFDVPNSQATFSFGVSAEVNRTITIPAHNLTITINGEAGQVLPIAAYNESIIVRTFQVGNGSVTVTAKGLSVDNDLKMDVVFVTPKSLAVNLTQASILFRPFFGLSYPPQYDQAGFREFATIPLTNSSEVFENGRDIGTKWVGHGDVEYFLYGAFGAQFGITNIRITNGTGQMQLARDAAVAPGVIQVGGPDVTQSVVTNELTIGLTWFILMFAVLELRPHKENQDDKGETENEEAKGKEGKGIKGKGEEGVGPHGKKQEKAPVNHHAYQSIVAVPEEPHSETSEVGGQSVHLRSERSQTVMGFDADGLHSAISEVETVGRKLSEGAFYAENAMPASERQAISATLANIGEGLRDLREGKDATRRIRERMSWLRDNAKAVHVALIQDATLRRLASE